MTRQHTPGPWVIKDGDIRDGRPRGRTIAKIRTYDFGWTLPQHMAEQDANTKLIASAPDLLRERDELLVALKRLVVLRLSHAGTAAQVHQSWEEAASAIKNVEGGAE